MDTALWPQVERSITTSEVVVKPIEEIIVTNTCKKPETLERKAAAARPPQKEQALNCPRCNSTNTKFCYYNNYSLTQPRYFCKSCRRYWTEGGSLRNIPVGGGSRKNKRSSSSSTSSSKKLPDLVTPPRLPESATQNPNIHVGQDLNLAFLPASQGYTSISAFVQVPNSVEENNKNQIPSPSSSSSPTSQLSALELLTGISSKGLNSFIPMPVPDPNTVYTSGFSLQEFKPTLNFSLDDGLGSGYGSLQGDIQDTTGRLLFPFEDLKQVPNTTDIEQNKDQGDSAGYWTGMLGGGSW